MLQISFIDKTGLQIYALIFNQDGTKVWSDEDRSWMDFYDEDNPSASLDQWDFAIALDEHDVRAGHYSAQIEMEVVGAESVGVSGQVDLEFYIQEGETPSSIDFKRGVDSVCLRDGEEFNLPELQAAIEDAIASRESNLSEVDRRRLARATARERRGGAR